MSNPPRPIRRDTRVFIDAVTREFGSTRKDVTHVVLDLDCHPVVQDHFSPDYRDVADMLRERIATCDAVIHIAGSCYGYEPRHRPPESPRRSYTQLEYDIANELGKPVYVFLTGDGFPADSHDPEPPELQELQQTHRHRLTSTDKIYNPVASAEQLEEKIRSLRLKDERLEGELSSVDSKVADLSLGSRRRFALGTFLLLVFIAIAGVGLSFVVKSGAAKLEDLRKQYANPDVVIDAIKSLIRKQADEEIDAARASAPDDWRKRVEIEKQRDQALERVDNLVATIGKGLAGKPDPVFVDAAEILNKEGVDEAIQYLEQEQPSTEKKISEATSLRDQAERTLREAYGPELLRADLYEIRMKWDAALKIREKAAREFPRWFDARIKLGKLLYRLARLDEAELHFRAARDLAATPLEQATSFNDLAILLQATNRLSEAETLYRQALAILDKSPEPNDPEFATTLSNLAGLLQIKEQTAEAETLYRRALEIHEQSYGPASPYVATDLNNLATSLRTTTRAAKSEPLYRRALAIDKQFYGLSHPEVATDLSNLAGLLMATQRKAEAETLYRRALEIDELSYGPDHPSVANVLDKLAELLESGNRAEQAEPLYRQALVIRLRHYGLAHSSVSTALINLARSLQATKRAAVAEPLYRQALVINEQLHGPEDPSVANVLYGLSALLYTPNRASELEPLMSRAVSVLARFHRSNGYEHPRQRTVVTKFVDLLLVQKLSDSEIKARLKAAIDGAENLSPFVPEVERILGPARPVAEVLSSLDRSDSEQGKSSVWSLPLAKTITPVLDQLLGPCKTVEEVLDGPERQYQVEGKSPVKLPPLGKPIKPYLDELLGKVDK